MATRTGGALEAASDADAVKTSPPAMSKPSGAIAFQPRSLFTLISFGPSLVVEIGRFSPMLGGVIKWVGPWLPEGRRADSGDQTLPDTHQTAGREQHDQEEHDPDHRVEASSDPRQHALLVGERKLDVANVVVDDDEGERAEPGSLDPAEPADDRDDQEVDRRAEAEVLRRDLAVPPDEEHTGQRRQKRREAERERSVKRDVVAERGEAHGLVAQAL